MNKQYDCKIILDLLPLSIENIVTEETQKVIDRHLLNCESCRQIYEDMTRELDITSTKKKRKKKKKHTSMIQNATISTNNNKYPRIHFLIRLFLLYLCRFFFLRFFFVDVISGSLVISS